MKNGVFKTYLKNIIIPCFVFSLITGVITGSVVVCFKFLASKIIAFSGEIYNFLRVNPIFIIVAIIAVIAIALGLSLIYKFAPDSKGGGIPNAMAYIRGLVTFKWLRTLFGVLFTSLFTFLIGAPLGNEGPCVMAGTTIGRGVISVFGKKNKAWDRYIMTGGASAGFATATNAPISGILFAIEEAHHRLSPMLLMVAGASVTFATITSHLLSSIFEINPLLFPHIAPITLQISELWIPLLVGIICGLFSVLYTKYFKVLRKAVNKKIKNGGRTLLVILVFFLTVVFGVFSNNFISTGHNLIDNLLLSQNFPIYVLLCILTVRFFMTSASASVAITGGSFIPTLAFGALVSAIISQIFIKLNLIGEHYNQVIILLGMTACFSGLIKTPLTAITFAFEALSLSTNLLPVAIVSIISYIISEIFCPHSANDEIMQIRVDEERANKKAKMFDAIVEIQPNSFVVGKQIRDVLWPNNLLVLSVKKSNLSVEIDEHGDNNLNPGDILHVRYSTYDNEQTHSEIIALVGEQTFKESDWQEE